MNKINNTPTVKSAERVVLILQKLSEYPQGIRFSELNELVNLPKSSFYQLINTLELTGMIDFESTTKKYSLGVKFWDFATKYFNKTSITQIAEPFLNELLNEYDETIQMAVLDEADVVYTMKLTSSRPIQLVSQVGTRLPAYATGIGKALLACLGEQRVLELHPTSKLTTFTDNTIATRDKLIEELVSTKERSYALDLGEYTPGIRCIASPVLGFNNTCVAAISISMLENDS